jgi:hypothetical protein
MRIGHPHRYPGPQLQLFCESGFHRAIETAPILLRESMHRGWFLETENFARALTAAGIVLRAPHELEMVLVVETSDFVRAIVRPAAAASRLGE